MTIEQTVEIPASRRLVLDLPPEIPVGRAKAALTLTFETPPHRDRIKSFRGILKGRGISLDRFMETQREDKALEDQTDEEAARK
ncbi:MAG: hypothetical protein LBU00_02750 [Treponema sp.]|jgi:hypothetical protein|nr:hypothetical protein [Treponema sp.]